MPDPREAGSEELVLAFLAEAADELVSGEAISDKLGLSRAAVWKHVDSLRRQGYRIDAVPSRGYRLRAIPDRVTALEIRPLLSTHDLGQTLHFYEEVDSTNDLAKRLAEEGAAHGEVVVAERQTAGRGRRGRSWISPAGKNLHFSVVLRPDLPPQRATELTLVASVALCHAVRQAGVDAGIKWPNDLVVEGRKLCGILTEMAADPDRVQWVVLGVGVNLNLLAADLPADLRDRVTSVAMERGQPVPRALFAAASFGLLEEWLDRHAEKGFAGIRDEWRVLSDTLGREVRVEVEGREIEGSAEDIDDSGALLIRSRGALERVHSGDVVHLRPR